jgi:hypothetical protein
MKFLRDFVQLTCVRVDSDVELVWIRAGTLVDEETVAGSKIHDNSLAKGRKELLEFLMGELSDGASANEREHTLNIENARSKGQVCDRKRRDETRLRAASVSVTKQAL